MALHKELRGGLSEMVTFGLRPEGSEKWQGHSRQRVQQALGHEVGCLVCSNKGEGASSAEALPQMRGEGSGRKQRGGRSQIM